MRRNMQNLSFLAIIGVLLSCAFFFSQQTKNELSDNLTLATETEIPSPETLEDLPDCSQIDANEERSACFTEAAVLSEYLVETKVDAILSMESESEDRMAFMEIQLTWEESRDADCEYLQSMASDETDAALAEAVCLYKHNLTRYDQLESYYCEWYDDSTCDAGE